MLLTQFFMYLKGIFTFVFDRNFLPESLWSDRTRRVNDENDVGKDIRAFSFFTYISKDSDSLQNQLIEIVDLKDVFVRRLGCDLVQLLSIVAVVVLAVAALMTDS